MKKLLMIVMALAAGMSARGDEAAFARSTGASMRLDTRTGTRLAATGARETIAYSPKWGGVASCTVTADGATLNTATGEGEVAWTPTTTGAHTLTHTAGDVAYTAQFTVLGDDVTQHAGALAASETWASNTVHLVTADVTVPSGKTLTIAPGAVVKFMTGTTLTATGTCMANGVIFTHVNDDTAGGDTLMDGDAAKPVMDGYKLTGNIYEDDATEERYTAPQTLSSSISGTLRLKGHKVYLANSSITVNSGATLTLLPGAIIKFASGCSMTVSGTLDAQGTRAAPIVFTSAKDDEWGGDTNGDGNKTYAQAGDWHQITGSGTVKMNYCQVLWCSAQNNQGGLYPNGGTWTFDNSIVAHCQYDCMRSYGGTFNANNSVFMDSSMGAAPSSGTCRFVNCVFYYLTTAIRWGSGSYYNCIFAEIAEDIIDTKFYSSTVNSPFGYCCFWAPNATGDKASAKVGKDGNIWADPLFLDPDNGDFRIAANSPCVDAGDGTVAPAVDFYGQPRMDVKRVKDTGVANADGVCPDIGIYEVPGSTPVPMPDLAVLSVSGPTAAVPGEEIAVTYVVTNRGAAAASGMVRDRVMLKGADAALGGQEIAAGVCNQAYGLEAGAAATFTARVKCPAVKDGGWTVGVTVNAERDVFEQVTANNAGWASEPTAVELEALAAGESRVTVGAGTATGFVLGDGVRMVRIASDATLDKVAVYGANGAVPASAESGVSAVRLGDGSWLLVLPEARPDEKGYVVIENGGAADVALKMTAGETKLAVYGVAPGRVAAVDGVSVTITGTGLAEGQTVTLGGRPATCVTKVNEAQIVATFDLKGMTAGASKVAVSGGAGRATLSVEVYKTTQGPKLEAKLELPSSVRDGRIYTAYVVYANVGDEPMTMPVFKVARTDSSTKLGLTTGAALTETKVFVGGIAPNHPAGMLQPGDSGRIPVFFMPSGSYGLKLTHTKETDNAEQFEAFGGVKPYLAVMSAAATRLNLRGRTEYNVHDFVDQALWEKNGVACAAVSGHLRDVLTHEAIANATVSLTPTNVDTVASASATTDANGYFQLANLPDGDYSWTVESGCTLVSSEIMTVVNQEDVNGIEVLVRKGGRIAGFAYGDDGAVLAGTTLVLCDDDTNIEAARTTADGSGRYVFDSVPNGGYALYALPSEGYCGCEHHGIGISESDRYVSVELIFRKGVVLEGVVTKGDGPVCGGTVRVATDGAIDETPVGEDGRYRFDGLPSGEYTVTYYSETCESKPTLVSLLVAGTVTCDLVAADRAIFIATRTKGFGSLTTHFLVMDSVLTNALSFAWDFNADGVVDSTAAEPDWTYDYVSTNTVVLEVSLPDGGSIRSVARDYVVVEEQLDTIYQDNAIIEGVNYGTLICTSATEDELQFTGRPSIAMTEGVVVMGRFGDDWFVRRVLSVSGDESGWRLRTANGTMKDVYKQLSVAVSVPVELEDSGNSKPRLAYAASPVKMQAKVTAKKEWNGGSAEVYAKCGVKPDFKFQKAVYIDYAETIKDGKDCISYALVGDCSATLSIEAYGKVGGRVSQTFQIPVKAAVPLMAGPVPVVLTPDFSIGVSGCVEGKISGWAKGGIGGKVRIGGEMIDGKWKWYKPFSFKPTGEANWDISGTGTFGITFTPGVKARIAGISSIVISPDLTTDFTFKGGLRTPPSFETKFKIGLRSEINFVDLWFWKLSFVPNKLDIAETSLFKWTGPVPDFTYSPLSCPVAPATIDFLNKSTGDKIELPYYKRTYQPKAYQWEFENEECSGAKNPSHYYAKEGRYAVYLKAIGEFITGPYRKKQTIVVGKPMEIPDDGDDVTDNTGGGTPAKSCDPNEMDGPLGTGDPETERFVKPGEWMDYTIYFENKADADVPAQEVSIDAQLSKYLDWSTFEMGEVAFNNQNETVLAGLKNGLKTVAQNGAVYKVQLSVAFDETTGKAHWYLRSYDPSQSAYNYWPAAVDAGFLPPNDETHRGEGHITYRVKVREDAPKGVRIDAAATIVFDQNEPIPTDPAWWNTVTAGGEAGFAAAEQTVDEGGALKIVVNGGNMDLASSVQVQATYNTAAAADLDLKNAMVNGEKPKSFKFPVTLNWAAGEVGEKTIEIPVVVDKAVEADEMLTLQLVNPMNLTIAGSDGEGAVVTQGSACTVTIRDPGYGELKAKVVAGSATKAEADALAKADKVFVGKSYVRVLANDATRGKVAGSALAADGKNVTLKATANKGWVFAGWYTDAACSAGCELTGYGDYRNPSLAYANTNGAVTVYARFIAPEEDGLALGEDFLPGEFAPGADCRIAVPVESVSYPTVKVTGLPAGMKFADKETLVKATKTTDAYMIAANTIYGAPTKAAAKPAVVTVTAKNLGGYQIVRQYEIVVKEGMSPVETRARVVSETAPYGAVAVDVVDDFSGTVSGAGVYPAGKTVTLKATASKGYVFSGWYEGDGAGDGARGASALPGGGTDGGVRGAVSQAASYAFTMPSNDVSYVAKFVTLAEDRDSIALRVGGFGALDPTAHAVSTNWAGVYLAWPLAASALSQPAVKVAGLPAGLKFAAKDVVDAKTHQVTVLANTIYGAPTAASKLDAKTGRLSPFPVTVTVTTAGKSAATYPLDLTVLPLPAWVAGTFDGGAATDPAGLATLTVASSGKVSGKWLSGGLAWALAAPYFDAAADPAAAEAEQAFRASVVGTSGKLAFTNAVTVVGDALGGIATNALFAAYQNNWKAEPWKTVAKPFAKAPALVLPAAGEQPGEIALKFAASGAATAAGKFLLGTDAKGKEIVHSASCAAVVVPETEPDAQGAFKAVVHLYFAPNEKKGFAGAVRLVRLRWTGTAFEVE